MGEEGYVFIVKNKFLNYIVFFFYITTSLCVPFHHVCVMNILNGLTFVDFFEWPSILKALSVSWAWWVPLCFAMNSMFPLIAGTHLACGSAVLAASGLLNTAAFNVFGHVLPSIQSGSGKVNPSLDAELYPIYVSVNAIVVVWFSAWPFAHIPTFPNVVYAASAATAWNTVGSYLAIMLSYDTVYYWYHRFMHADSTFFKHIHIIHHQLERPGNIWDSLYAHPLEIFTGLWLQVVPLYIVPMHVAAVVMYYATIYVPAAMYHSGLKFPSIKYLLSVSFHDGHHRRRNCNYGFFTEVWDVLMNTGEEAYKKRLA